MPFDGTNSAPIATKMLEIFGEDGKNWIKGRFENGDGRCLLGAANEAMTGIPTGISIYSRTCASSQRTVASARVLYDALQRVFPELILSTQIAPFLSLLTDSDHTKWNSVASFNNSIFTTWQDVLKVIGAVAEIEMEKVHAV